MKKGEIIRNMSYLFEFGFFIDFKLGCSNGSWFGYDLLLL